ncbi:type II toxin-antitoxin system RelE/ParE family toxin [Endozoicomonas lisbonensis]|uniref:Toxin ParE1/3/4 n=1 Tax=Endozoicomonas lisbonensis TaxID=3120522 RepID=A0ABV2SP96_9GAMM
MNIYWMEEAEYDLNHWLDYMAIRNPEAGNRIAVEVLEAVESLKENPLKGRVGKVHNTRELIIPDNPLKVIYTVEESLISIMFVPHQRQRWSSIQN